MSECPVCDFMEEFCKIIDEKTGGKARCLEALRRFEQGGLKPEEFALQLIQAGLPEKAVDDALREARRRVEQGR